MTSAMMLPSSLPFLVAAQRAGGVDASTAAGFGFTAAWFAVGIVLCACLWMAGDLLGADRRRAARSRSPAQA